MTAKSLVATRWVGSQTGTVYYGLFDPEQPTDAQRLAYETKKHGAVSARVEVDFSPATSAQLNRPARELVEVERDRLRGLLAEWLRDSHTPDADLELIYPAAVADRIRRTRAALDAALPQQQPNGEAA